MRRPIFVLLFLAILFSALPALSESSFPNPRSPYCKGIPEDVKTHCAQILLDNYKRSLEKIKNFGARQEIKFAASILLSRANLFVPPQVLEQPVDVRKENPLTTGQMMAINAFLPYGYEKEASTSMRGSEEFITDELESVTIEASASMRGNEEFIIEPESVTIEESASMRVQDQSMMSPPERIVFQTDSFQCLDDHRKCLEGQTVGRIGCVIGLIICWAQGISFR